ncbi:MAG: PaaI family thioesterase [Deltaproteobacteria bacterium]|nr:PaaI family thioesterase [Deltaproteobacteria bacterium]
MTQPAPVPNPAYVEEMITMVGQADFPSHMAMRLTTLEIDRATVELTVKRCHFQPYGIVHGGVLATLIDTATFWAAFLRLPESDGLVNLDLKLNYLQPVAGGHLTARGRTLWTGKSLCYAEAEVRLDDRQLVAHGTSTLKILPGRGLAAKISKFLAPEGEKP